MALWGLWVVAWRFLVPSQALVLFVAHQEAGEMAQLVAIDDYWLAGWLAGLSTPTGSLPLTATGKAGCLA